MMNRVTAVCLILFFTFFCSSVQAAEVKGKSFVLVIDAGHGGHDPGALGKWAKEKDINLKTALAFGQLVERNCPDVKVVYTRKTDVFVELHRRAQIANNAKADLFVSVHTNSLPKGKIARGAETYTLGMARASANLEVAKRENNVILLENDYQTVYKGFNPNSSESYIIFEFMQDQNMAQSVNFAKKVQTQFRNTAKRTDKGVKQAGFLVLRETSMPSVLVELGYISTPDEENYLASENGAQEMGRCIYNAFLNYRNKKVETSQTETRQEETHTADSVVPKPEPKVVVPVENPAPAVREPQGEKTGKPAADEIVFAVQILTSETPLKTSDRRFKGLTDISHYKEGKLYKYTCGNSPNYNEVWKRRKEVLPQFRDCFIIALRGGEKMDVNEAIRIYKAKK